MISERSNSALQVSWNQGVLDVKDAEQTEADHREVSLVTRYVSAESFLLYSTSFCQQFYKTYLERQVIFLSAVPGYKPLASNTIIPNLALASKVP